jgi:hypothetical protein
VGAEAVEQQLQVLEVEGGSFVSEPLLERAVKRSSLPSVCGLAGAALISSTPASASLRSNSTVTPSGRPVRLEWLSESSWRGSGARGDEAVPGRFPGRALAGDRAEQEAGVVVQAVNDPGGLPPASLSWVPSICQRSFATSRSKRLVAFGRRAGCGATRWLRRSARWIVATAGGSIPARRSSAWMRRAPQRGCRLRNSAIRASSEGSICAGEERGRRERGSSPATPSSR